MPYEFDLLTDTVLDLTLDFLIFYYSLFLIIHVSFLSLRLLLSLRRKGKINTGSLVQVELKTSSQCDFLYKPVWSTSLATDLWTCLLQSNSIVEYLNKCSFFLRSSLVLNMNKMSILVLFVATTNPSNSWLVSISQNEIRHISAINNW